MASDLAVGVDEFDKHTNKDSVAAILNSRRSGERVREFVELLYVNKFCTLSQRMDWGRRRNPHLARFDTLDGMLWDSRIFCGHTPPSLFARRVDDLSIEIDANGEEKPTWTERTGRDIERMREALGLRGSGPK